MPLFLVHASNSDGTDMDWFVRAENYVKALELYATDETIRAFGPTEGGIAIHKVPDGDGPAGVIDWSDVETELFTDEKFVELANYEDDE